MKRTKKRSALRTLALLLVCAFLLQCLPLVIAEDSSALAPAPSEEIALPDMVASLMAADGETYLQRAYDQEQSLNDVVLQINSRTYVSYMFNDPVKYTDATGTHDKDTTLIAATGGYRQKANDIQSFLPTHVTSGVTYSADGYSVKFTPSAAQNVVVAPIAVTNNGYGENYALYQRVFGENTALKYTPYYNSLKEEIVLNAYTGQTAFSFLYETNGLSFSDTENGLFLVNSEGETVFTFPELIAYDSNGKQVECDYTIETAKAGAIYLFTVSVPQPFLTAEDTVYPVYVDPTVELKTTTSHPESIVDTTIYENQPSVVASSASTLAIGYYPETTSMAKSLFKFPGILSRQFYANILTGDNAKRITLYFYNANRDLGVTSYNSQVRLYNITQAWNVEEATDDTVTNLSASTLSAQTIDSDDEYDYNTGLYNSWYGFEITEYMVGMLSEEPSSYGVALDSGNDATTIHFASSQYSATNKRPYIKFEYSDVIIPQTQNPSVVSGATYALINTTFSSCAVDAYVSTLKLKQKNTSDTLQHFKITYRGDGKYILRSPEWGDPVGLSLYTDSLTNTSWYQLATKTDENDSSRFWYLAPVAEGSPYFYLINALDPLYCASVGSDPSVGDAISYLDDEQGGIVWTLEWVTNQYKIPDAWETNWPDYDDEEYPVVDHYPKDWPTSWTKDPFAVFDWTTVPNNAFQQYYNSNPISISQLPSVFHYSLYAQNNPSAGKGWNVENTENIYCSSDGGINLKSKITNQGCVVTAFAMVLNNYDLEIPYGYDDPRTEVVERYDVPIDPFTVTLINSAPPWPTISEENGIMSYSATDDEYSSVTFLSYNIQNTFGITIEKYERASNDDASTIANRLHNLLLEHPEGIVVRFDNEGHSLVILKSLFNPNGNSGELTGNNIGDYFLCYDPYQMANDSDGYGMELVLFNKTYTRMGSDTKPSLDQLSYVNYITQ